jgi:hypothetical protein
MNSKMDLFKRKPNPYKQYWEEHPTLAFYIIIAVVIVVVFGVCLWCQAPISHGHTTGMI